MLLNGYCSKFYEYEISLVKIMLNKMILLINPRKWDNILFNNIYEIKNLDKTEYIFYFFCSIFSDKGCDIIFIMIYTKDQTIFYTLD